MNRDQISAQFSQPLLSIEDIAACLERGVQTLDVRSDEEVEEGTLSGTLCIPHEQVPERMEELEAFKDKELLIFCRVGGRADRVLQYLQSKGFKKLYNAGGYDDVLKSLS